MSTCTITACRSWAKPFRISIRPIADRNSSRHSTTCSAAAARFFKDDSDTTVIADAFPLLNALKEVHLVLAEGAHNQFGDLTWTARAEMMTIQWMLARPEMKEFLRGRYMVPYQEEWMGAVDSMKKASGLDRHDDHSFL